MLSEEKKQHLQDKFKAETIRQLITLRQNLLKLEQAPDDKVMLEAMLFSCHTIKGNLGMMQMLAGETPKLAEIASVMEQLLIRLQHDQILPVAELFSRLEQNLSLIETEFII